MWVEHKQFWLGPRRAGLTTRFWADCDRPEVERVVSSCGLISLAGKQILVAERLAGLLGGVRIEERALLFFDITTREPLRTHPNPLPVNRSCGCLVCARSAPPARPSPEPIRIQRRASDTGVIVVADQKGLPRAHSWRPGRLPGG
jgi:hypothetical protein